MDGSSSTTSIRCFPTDDEAAAWDIDVCHLLLSSLVPPDPPALSAGWEPAENDRANPPSPARSAGSGPTGVPGPILAECRVRSYRSAGSGPTGVPGPVPPG